MPPAGQCGTIATQGCLDLFLLFTLLSIRIIATQGKTHLNLLLCRNKWEFTKYNLLPALNLVNGDIPQTNDFLKNRDFVKQSHAR